MRSKEGQADRAKLEQIVRRVLEEGKEPPDRHDAANGERYAIEAAQRAVEHAYGRKKAAKEEDTPKRRP